MKLRLKQTTVMFTLVLFGALAMSDTLTGQPGRSGRRMAGTVAGTISSQADGAPIPGATVSIWNASDSSLVTGAVTNAKGVVQIAGLPPGLYYVTVESLGYERMTVDSVAVEAGSVFNLGEAQLAVDPTAEDEGVTVTGERSDIEFRSDRTIYNVEDQAVTSGGNAIDVLRNVPEVEVDIDDKVSLRGSQNVAVHINGRPVPISGDALSAYLKSLPAEMIERVEIIPNPSAKYDPEGMAGIVNIVLRQQKEKGGVSGTTSASVGTGDSYSLNGSVNWRTSRVNWFNSYSFRYNEWDSDGTVYRENRIASPVTILNQDFDSEAIRRSHVLNSSLDFDLTDKQSLRLSALVTGNNSNSTSLIGYGDYLLSGEFVDTVDRRSLDDGSGLNLDMSLGYDWISEPSTHEFSTEVRVFSNDDDGVGDYVETAAESGAPDTAIARQVTDRTNRNYGGTFQVDYMRPLGNTFRMEAGYKGDITRIDNGLFSESLDPSTGSFVPDIELNNTFVYDEQIHAAYGIFGFQKGKIDGQVGLRAEQALTDFDLETTDEQFENDYFSLFPSASAGYSFSQTTRLRASYSRRINRPGVWRLNPFPQYEDRQNLRTGNPYLRPEYVNSVELGLNHFTGWGSISLSPYYRHSTDLIERWLTIDSNGITTVTWENFESTDSYGAEVVGTFRVGQSLRGFANLSLYQFDLDGSNVETDLANESFGWSTSANATWAVTDWLDLQGNYFYRAPIDISQGEITEMQSLDLATKFTFLSDRASLSLRVSDIFNTMKFDLYRDDDTYYIDVHRKWESRRGTISFSWNFGKQEYQQRRRRDRRSQEGTPTGGSPAGVGF